MPPFLKPALFLAAALPLLRLLAALFGWAGQSLGANPIEELLHGLGWWGLFFLLVTLAITPLRHLTGRAWLVRLRRLFGLWSFAYLLAHFTVYAWLDQSLSLAAIVADIVKRPYITVGFTALLLLLPLALTSTNRMVRRLGRNWKKLHRLVYPAAVLGVWHFWWQVKQDIREPLLFAAVLAVLLVFRLLRRRQQRRPAPARQP